MKLCLIKHAISFQWCKIAADCKAVWRYETNKDLYINCNWFYFCIIIFVLFRFDWLSLISLKSAKSTSEPVTFLLMSIMWCWCCCELCSQLRRFFFLLAGWYMMPWCNGEITHSRIFYLNMHSKLSAKITFQCTKSERCKNWNIFKMQKKIMVKIVQKKKTFAAFLFQYFYRILYWKTIFSLWADCRSMGPWMRSEGIASKHKKIISHQSDISWDSFFEHVLRKQS